MFRRLFAFTVLMTALGAVLSGAAGAEATPTDLACVHEHVRTTTYFFDSPAYTPVNSSSHRVSGPAAVETVCLDCGKVLSAENVAYAEEIRPHSMKKGVCALCGYRRKTRQAERGPADAPGERTFIAQEDGEAAGLLSLTLTSEDLAELEDSDVSTVLIRGKNGSAAIALGVEDALSQTENADADLYLELAEREDGSFFAALFLVSGPGGRKEPENQGISLRFYQDSRTAVRVSVAPSDSDELVEADGFWDERGYWSVRYLEEGTYFLLQ